MENYEKINGNQSKIKRKMMTIKFASRTSNLNERFPLVDSLRPSETLLLPKVSILNEKYTILIAKSMICDRKLMNFNAKSMIVPQ